MRNFIYLFCPLLTVNILVQRKKTSFWQRNGRSPFEKLKDLGYNLPEEFALLPPIILDDVSTFWTVRGGNNLLTPYTVPREPHQLPQNRTGYISW